ncbi:MAG: hypothetical protein N3A38_00505 [Planctomycetota bacterium]|nr:hypothetical protein [Planctomycetota bacterium]
MAGVAVRRLLIVAIAAAAIAAGGWAIWKMSRSEEDRVRDVIREAAEGARRRKPSDITVHLHRDFRFKGMGKDEIHAILTRIIWQEFQVVEAAVAEPIVVRLEEGGKKAKAEFRATVRAKQSPEETTWEDLTKLAGGHRYAMWFVKTEEGWKATGAEVVEEK